MIAYFIQELHIGILTEEFRQIGDGIVAVTIVQLRGLPQELTVGLECCQEI